MERKESRKRKTHTKSRKGCANCKLRRIKCDEGRPTCERCKQYGVQCNYDAPKPIGNDHQGQTLQLAGETSFSFASMKPPPMTLPPEPPRDSVSPETTTDASDAIENMLGMSLELQGTDDVYTITKDDIAILKRFIYRTAYTVGTSRTMNNYQRNMARLAAIPGATTTLTHIILTLTLMHDRYLEPIWSSVPSSKESFHCYHGTALLSACLRKPIREIDKDPLWATAALLGCITIASIDATTTEEAWPLKEDSITDLDWLKMSDGKKEVWRLCDPLRPESIFRDALLAEQSFQPEQYADATAELRQLFPYVTKIYGFDESHATLAEEQRDPYHTAVSILLRLLELECNHSTIMYFLSFLGHMDPRFRALLQQKDARALLLLAWWYGKMCQYGVWWQTRRMRLEGRAICVYLERKYGGDKSMMELLEYPKMMTGVYAGQ